MMESGRTAVRARALWLAALLLVAPGCTKWDDWLPGTPFTPDQPEAAVTLTGGMNSDRIAESSDGCTAGDTVFWGQVTNTGDVTVTNVEITIEVFDAAGGSLGSYDGDVFNGEVEEIETAAGTVIVVAGTTLEVDQSGSFTVCTPVPFGAAARTEYRTTQDVVEEVE